MPRTPPPTARTRSPRLALPCLILLALGSTAPALGQGVPEKASPFSAVRWEGDEPLVRFDGTWYGFVSLDGLAKAVILDYARRIYDDRWKKRFSEDLVELLRGMGHTPGVEVRLVLLQEGRPTPHTGRMTEENRSNVLRFNQRMEGRLAEETPTRAAPPLSIESGQATESQRRMARQMGEQVDRIWDARPAGPAANLRFLLRRNGQPFAGVVSITTEFTFRASRRGRQVSQGFNPNGNGRWVYEDLDPGSYEIELRGLGRFDGWVWNRSITVAAGEAPLFTIDLDPPPAA